jgi:hypothetical protein
MRAACISPSHLFGLACSPGRSHTALAAMLAGSPRHLGPCSGLATTTHQIEGFRQALPSYLDVLRLRPGHVPFVRVLSGLVHAGEIDEARAVLNRALQFSDDENLRQRRELLP